MKKAEFSQLVYDLVGIIPYGRVTTYGLIALMIGYPQSARQVGRILFNTPPFLDLPCHRVVNYTGRLAPNWSEQRQLLEEEGIPFKSNGNVDLEATMPWMKEDTENPTPID